MTAPGEDAEPVARYRLAMWNDVHDAIGGLYDEHAGRGASPRFAFRIGPEQPLPLGLPGAVVTAVRAASSATPTAVETPDGLLITFGRRLRTGTESMPALAERGKTLVHPAAIHFERSWRYPLGSRRSVDEARREWRLRPISLFFDLLFVTPLLLVLAYGLWATVDLAAGGDLGGWQLLVLPVLLFTVVRTGRTGWLVAKTTLDDLRISLPRARALRRASRKRSARSSSVARVTCCWCAGSGTGPILVVRIPPEGSHQGGDYEVIDVPDGFDPREPSPATIVRSENGDPLSITIGDATLVPVARLTHAATVSAR